MEFRIISQCKDVRLSIIHDTENMNVYCGVSYKSKASGKWRLYGKFKPDKSGFKTALMYYYRMILCRIDSNIIMDIDNDVHNNKLFYFTK